MTTANLTNQEIIEKINNAKIACGAYMQGNVIKVCYRASKKNIITIELPATFISHYSNENELVCDFFGGSWSTMAACEQLNRICKSIEFDPVNCQIIINRMEKCYNLKAEKI